MLADLGPAALLTEQVGVEVGHLPVSLVGEAPHQLPVAHMVELLPGLLRLAAILKQRHRLNTCKHSNDWLESSLEDRTALLAVEFTIKTLI